MAEWFGGNWDTLLAVALVTVAVYLSAVFAIRFLDRRALAEMSGFDFVVAVAMGTIIGRTATTREPTYLQGVAALVVLLLTHRLVSWLRTRSSAVQAAVDREPTEIVRDGELNRAAMEAAHLTTDDVESQIRLHGLSDLRDVHRMVLETSGTVSVVARRSSDPPSSGGDDE